MRAVELEFFEEASLGVVQIPLLEREVAEVPPRGRGAGLVAEIARTARLSSRSERARFGIPECAPDRAEAVQRCADALVVVLLTEGGEAPLDQLGRALRLAALVEEDAERIHRSGA